MLFNTLNQWEKNLKELQKLIKTWIAKKCQLLQLKDLKLYNRSGLILLTSTPIMCKHKKNLVSINKNFFYVK